MPCFNPQTHQNFFPLCQLDQVLFPLRLLSFNINLAYSSILSTDCKEILSLGTAVDLQNVGDAYESVNKLKLDGYMKNLLNLCYPFNNSLSFIIYFLYREFVFWSASRVGKWNIRMDSESECMKYPMFSLCSWLWRLAEMTLVKDWPWKRGSFLSCTLYLFILLFPPHSLVWSE